MKPGRDAQAASGGGRRQLLLASLGLFGGLAPAAAQTLLLDTRRPRRPVGEPLPAPRLKVVPVTDGLVHPWALAFLPDGSALVTERPGRLRRVVPGQRSQPPIAGLPAVDARGQGGLLGLALDPDFGHNRLVYWSYSERQGRRGPNGTAVARGRLDPTMRRLDDVHVIFRQQPKVAGTKHFGSRLVFGRDGRLFVTLGERQSRAADAQRLANTLGKIVRIEADGRIPPDNPLVGRPDADPAIWSWGHRNVQGAALRPGTDELWISEHGPQGGDEINLVQRGADHGWPQITHGRAYGSGTRLGSGSEREGVVAPAAAWVPLSLAPAGMCFLTSERYGAAWRGDLFVAMLRGETLVRLKLDSSRVVAEQRLLPTVAERLRDVRQGPDGWLWALMDNADGRLLRIETA